MKKLTHCPACRGFTPADATQCPHCETRLEPARASKLLATVLAVCGGGAFALTLMACYGGPPCRSKECEPPDLSPPADMDRCGDGMSSSLDGGCTQPDAGS